MLALKLALACALICVVHANNTTNNADPSADKTASQIFNPVNEPPAPVDQNKGYLIQDRGNGLYFLTDGYYWGMAVVSTPITIRKRASSSSNSGNSYGSNGRNNNGWVYETYTTLAVVDAPTGNYNGRFINAVYEVLNISGAKTVSHFIYSHQHRDHIGSAFQVKNAFPNVEIIAHQLTARRLVQRRDPARPIPNTVFTGSYTLPQFDLYLSDALNSAHAPGNTIIYSRSRSTLMAVDLVFPGWMPFDNIAEAEYVPDYYEGVKVLRNFQFDTILGGHVSRPGTRADVELALDYNQDLLDAANYGLGNITAEEQFRLAGLSGVFDPASPNFGNSWQFFRAVYERTAEYCVDYLVERGWGERLASFDVFAFSHCMKATESQRID